MTFLQLINTGDWEKRVGKRKWEGKRGGPGIGAGAGGEGELKEKVRKKSTR